MYFPCDSKERVPSFQKTMEVSCALSSGELCAVRFESLSAGQPIPGWPAGVDATVQYFDYGANTAYQYDKNSVIFRVTDCSVDYIWLGGRRYDGSGGAQGDQGWESDYSTGKVYRLTQNSPAEAVARSPGSGIVYLAEMNDRNLVLYRALSSDPDPTLDPSFAAWAAKQDMYFASVKAGSAQDWARAGTAAGELAKTIDGIQAGKAFAPGDPKSAPCLLVYYGCGTCTAQYPPTPDVAAAMNVQASTTWQDLTAFIKQNAYDTAWGE